NAATALEEGRHAATVFDTSQLVPPTFRELFRIGEQTNRLTLTLNALSMAMNAQVEQSAQRFITLLTPVLTLVLGSGIGLLVYTLMGAILEVNELAF
ncbi:type II secretion system F family protein, partial [Halomonas sp. SIMBA_159]